MRIAPETTWLAIAKRMGRFFWDGVELPQYTDGSPADPEGEIHEARKLSVAKLLTSKVDEDRHIIALDIDMPVAVAPSSTPGHYHLYIDHEMSTADYLELVDALAKAGVVQDGYAHMAHVRKMTRVRTPWTSKGLATEQNHEYLDAAIEDEYEPPDGWYL